MLKRRCRSCKQEISWLYPFIELITALVFSGLYYLINPHYWLAYGIFFSALIIVIRTDLETMFILRSTTLGIIPLGIIASIVGWLPLTPQASILGTVFGYALLWIVRKVFWHVRQLEGLGQGDLELLAAIGAFTGPLGCWSSLVIGSLGGSVTALALLLMSKQPPGFSHIGHTRLPFGPFLALGALAFVFFSSRITSLLLGL